MSLLRPLPLPAMLLMLGCALPLGTALAQAPAPAQADSEPLDGRRNQKIEHLRTEDAGAVVDETRYGGRMQQITVQPKAGTPSYEVLPDDAQRQGRGQSESGSNGNGPRVCNVLKF